jgi:penicillin-binding protein 1B
MPAKKDLKASAAQKNPSNSNKRFFKRHYVKWCLSTLLKLLFIALLTLGLYAIYLDGKVRNKFEGQRWQIPVQVFGQIEKLSIDDNLVLSQLSESLKLAGYQRVNKVQHAGEFAQSKKRLIVYRRAFDFGSGVESAVKLTLDVKQGRITQLWQDKHRVDQITLEPILLDRIVPKSKEDRLLVALEQVPERLLDTLLLVEDREFYFHAGVSPLGILRALYSNLRAGRTVQGGSTLTQQLVKNMFLTRDKTLWRKVNEAVMALILEYRYSKDQLLEAYINEVYLGQHYANGIYGFGLAAEFYFGKTLAQLSTEQMAMLVGQVKGPSYYDPWRRPKQTLNRRDLILRLMYEKHYISRQEFELSLNAPLSIRDNRRSVKQKYPAYLQLVKQELAQYVSDNEQQSGIRVFTGFSHLSQQYIEQTVSSQLAKLESKSAKDNSTSDRSVLQAAMIVTDISSGEIRALVGDRKRGYAGFNRALQAKRPVGSLIKPAIFLAALERYEQFNFATVLQDKPITLNSEEGKAWQPKNYSGKFLEQVSLIEALVLSLNIPTVNLGMQLGLDKVAEAIHLLGYQHDIVTRPSMLLGSLNMSPFEINQLYLPMANQGNNIQGHAVNKIVSAQGETLWQFQAAQEQLFSSQGAYLLDYALTEVAQRGTAKSLAWRLKDQRIAGKTGTTNEQRDSWFIGYDQQHLVTTWVGKDNNAPTELTGSSGALILFADFMKKQRVRNIKLAMPESIVMQSFDVKTGLAVFDNCVDSASYPVVAISVLSSQACKEKVSPKKKKSWLEKLFG